MKTLNLLFTIIIVLSLSSLALIYSHSQVNAAISADTANRYPVCGSTAGAVAGPVSQVIEMKGLTALTLLVNATGGNMGANNLVVQVSEDGLNNYITVDTISLGSATVKGITYSNSLKATTVTVNPAAYPFVKVSTSAGVTSVTETLYWCAGQF